MLCLLAIGGIADYNIAFRPASIAYDSTVLKTATALANLIEEVGGETRLNLPPIAERILRSDQYDHVFYSVRNANNVPVAGDNDLPPPTHWTATAPQLYDAQYREQPVRVAALAVERGGRTFRILAAETMGKRRRIVWEVLMGMLVPEIIVAMALVALVWHGIKRGLLPLADLRRELLSRDVNELAAMPKEGYPEELQPVLTALNQLLERLRLTLSAQQRFIADAAHQLRTPLAGLQTLAAVAAKQPNLAQCQASINRLQVATQRVVHLTNQLLTLARADPGSKDAREFKPVDLAELIAANIDAWVPRAIAKDIDLGFSLNPAHVIGTALLLRELVTNLIENALCYTPAGGHVTVRTDTEGPHAILTVEDDGPGIPAEERDRVLERFYRIAGTPGDGCGLGLAIVKEIADAHGGNVTITEGPQDCGSAVRICFPNMQGSDTRAQRELSAADQKGKLPPDR
jgi:two-component system, OmpR family, sensor histidine kinase TctE